MKEFVRGEIIQFFDWQFRDKDKDVTVPEGASLRIRYLECGCQRFEDIDLVINGTSWSAEWDSAKADPGTIYFYIESDNPKVAVAEGEFRLKANPANPRGE